MKQQTNQIQKQKKPCEDRQHKEIEKAFALQVNALAADYFANHLPAGQTKMVFANC